ncbi:MAG: malto-oligosyltrehalose synthase [Terriglobales bacterium]
MSTRSSSTAPVADYAGLSECLDRMVAQKRHNRPVSTYRLQFHAGFRLEDARRIVPYLAQLGITHCYASPILKARAGSTHGYDITDHNQLNPEIGTEEEFQALVQQLQAHNMGLLLDTVPNHMGIGRGDNPWWQDVLENGRASEYADFFDIDWEPVKAELRNKVLMPVLGAFYGDELEQGHFQLCCEDGRFLVAYYDMRFPLDPQTWPMIFETLGDLRVQPEAISPSPEDRSELENILWNLRALPPHNTTNDEIAQRRRREIPELKRRFRELVDRSPQVKALVDEAVRLCNGTPGQPRSFDPLHRLLEVQAYRLALWRVSSEEINYRRFFDINDLVGLRMDNPRVFAATHKLVRRLLAEGSVTGLRMDHPDGLLNPVQYFTRVQMLYAASQCLGSEPQGPLAENGIEVAVQEIFGRREWMNENAPLYVIAEKILEPGETLPLNWPVDGTVGYDFVRLVNGVFIDRRNARAFTQIYRRFIGGPLDVQLLIYESKKQIMRTALSSEVTVLSHMLEEISAADRRARDFTRAALTVAIVETIACFPIYRTYIDERGNISERDRAYINEAIQLAKRRNAGTTGALFDWLRDMLLLTPHSTATPEWQRQQLRFALKFQQLTGPVMAKGLEDTVCYVYNRFISVNDVGCTPAEFGISLDEFHNGNRERAEHWPFSMLATSTHDTKRSEDVRARLNVLSEMPREWATVVGRWRRQNRTRKRTLPDGRAVPDFNEEYFLYQTLVGAWPLRIETREARDSFIRRIQQYMMKAVHEAKVNLSWVNQNPEYVAALEDFIARILGEGPRGNGFARALEQFLPPIMYFGVINSLAQVVLKLTCPGVSDIYQGNELFDFSLVDPDNRRPVDFNLRQQLLEDVLRASGDTNQGVVASEGDCAPAGSPADYLSGLLENWRDGRLKLWTTLHILRFRRDRAPLFRFGDYTPLGVRGENQQHVIAFARQYERQGVIVVVPRFAYTLMRGLVAPPIGDAWGDTELSIPPGFTYLRNVLTGESVSPGNGSVLLCREIFARFPVAVLATR